MIVWDKIDIMELAFHHHKSLIEENYDECQKCVIEINRRIFFMEISDDDFKYLFETLKMWEDGDLHYNPNINGFLDNVIDCFLKYHNN